MLSVTRLLNGTVTPADALRYGRRSGDGPAHLLHFAKDKTPVVVWNVTQSCNLHCAHCYADSHDRTYPGELSTEEGMAVIDDLGSFGVPTLLFSGGEPLRRPDLFELAARAGSVGMRTVLSTNGTLIDSGTAERIAAAGFSYAGVSIDAIGTLHDKLRGKRGAFKDALAGIESCRRVGLRTGIRFTVHGRNRETMGDVFELAEHSGVERLCIYHLAYSGRGERIRKHDLTPDQTRELVEEVFDRVRDFERRNVPIEVLTVDNPVDSVLLYKRVEREQPQRAGEVLELLRWNGGNQSGVAVACIDPQGNIHPDQFSWHVTAGNVRDRPFSSIWSGSDNEVLAPYRQRPRRLEGRCQNCRWLDICNGGLRVRAESATGSMHASDPACYLSEAEVSQP